MGKAEHINELTLLRAEVKRLRSAQERMTPDLTTLLKRRGFTIFKKEPAGNLLLPQGRYRTGYYRRLHKYSFRLFLRDVIQHQDRFALEDVARYAAPPVAAGYLAYLRSIGIIRKKTGVFALAHSPITSFGPTLEWYIAELFKREFGSDAAWGVKFRRPSVGGDYDVLAKLGDALLYIEVKSSPPKQIYDSEVSAFFDRLVDLAPALAVFFMDTELRMKDKIVPLFEKELQKRYTKPPHVRRLEHELFHINDRIFIVNAKESVLRNFEAVLHRHYEAVSELPPARAPLP